LNVPPTEPNQSAKKTKKNEDDAYTEESDEDNEPVATYEHTRKRTKKTSEAALTEESPSPFYGPRVRGPFQVTSAWRNTAMKDMLTNVFFAPAFTSGNDIEVEVINGGMTLRYLVKVPPICLNTGNIMRKRFDAIHSKVPATDTETKDFNKEQAAIEETIATLKSVFNDGIIRSEEIVALPFPCEEGKPKTSWVPLKKDGDKCIAGMMIVFMKKYIPPVEEVMHEEVEVVIDGHRRRNECSRVLRNREVLCCSSRKKEKILIYVT